jgi:hypothetical protein
LRAVEDTGGGNVAACRRCLIKLLLRLLLLLLEQGRLRGEDGRSSSHLAARGVTEVAPCHTQHMRVSLYAASANHHPHHHKDFHLHHLK